MKKGLLLLILSTITINSIWANKELDSLYLELDKKINNTDVYSQLKESRINLLKNEKSKSNISIDQKYSFNTLLYDEYKTYISDSAIHYMNKNLDIAYEQNDIKKINETSIDQSLLFSNLGMYKEALDVLDKTNRKYFNEQDLIDYYSAYRYIYAGLSSYTQNNREKKHYHVLTETYRDSIFNISPHSSVEYLRIEETFLREKGKLEEALKVNDIRISELNIGTPTYALVSFHRSLIYRKMNNKDMEKKYLLLSAISDIQSAIKDNASIPILANMLMQEGNTDRAYKYIRFSLDNINDYNTRLRSSEIINIQGIIDKAYQLKNESQKNILRVFIILISILLVLLTISVFYVYKQMKKGVLISKHLKNANIELNALNLKLHDMNEELKSINIEVVEANHIKEEYISYFLNECSKYIDKLDSFRRMVNKRIQEKQVESLYKITKNTSLKDDDIKELFSNFDTMFIHLFPDFIEKINLLLTDDEQIVLKKGEILNVELRIYALIRLGIDDSSKIANFLGYSVNTIYNYRAKVKSKAKIAREDFDTTIKKIGTFAK